MSKRSRTALAIVGGIVIGLWMSMGSATASGPESGLSREFKPAPAAPSPVEYAGVEACKTCHEDIYNNFDSTAHFKPPRATGTGASRATVPLRNTLPGAAMSARSFVSTS